MANNILIKNAHSVLTGLRGDAARSPASDVRVADGVITQMGKALPALPGERVLDARDCVIYPGWVNTHHHLFQSLLKGVPAGINLTLSPWLQAVPFSYRRMFNEERLRLAARIGIVELMLSGCTTIADHHYLYYPGMSYDASAALFDEADKLGARFMLQRGGATVARKLEANDRHSLEPETLDGMLAGVERTAARFHQRGPRPRTRVSMAPTTANVSVRREELTLIARAARGMDIPLHTHMSESVAVIEHCRSAYGCLPIEYLAEHEWLGPDVSLAHLTHLSDGELRLLGSSGTGMAHCPQSNARLADGVARAPDLDLLGGAVSIGVDGAASNEAADMLSEVHFCWLMHRAHAGAATRPKLEGGGEAGADRVSVEQVVRWATAGGARVLGFDGVGTLEVGQAADLAVYDLDTPRYFGLHDMAIGPVVCAGRPRLRWLLVDGRVVVEEDAIPGLDMARLRAEANADVLRLMRAA
ncbi:8-oxoguanine deaminase [Janthinobacterium sp. CG_23.3]|uniref:amidohydrolase family protein n=1 Tax=unclassified Janthinobacterium TaxID=2610881 RepID=UPI00034DA5E3|nr:MULTISPECIES: amidohydrolase family protein [unclassified Janthinobacterium]MEC5160705.1 8-oxoguanine deaminase [Janthinobacterium sp. CG_S6]